MPDRLVALFTYIGVGVVVGLTCPRYSYHLQS